MAMSVARAKELLEWRPRITNAMLAYLASGPKTELAILGRAYGDKQDAHGRGRELLTALVAAGKVIEVGGVYQLTSAGAVVLDETREEGDVNLNSMNPDQLLALATQLQQLATTKKKEVDPDLLRRVLEGGQLLIDTSDTMAEATDKFRTVLEELRKARNLPTAAEVRNGQEA